MTEGHTVSALRFVGMIVLCGLAVAAAPGDELLNGLLFWHVNYWGDNKVIEGSEPYLEWTPACISGMTGDGVLIYPHRSGLISSIRLENVRDGIEDHDYLALLERKHGRNVPMAAFRRLVSSMTEFSRDAALLDEVREDIARMITGQ